MSRSITERKEEEEVAIGTKLFSRINDVERLLSSIPDWISTVYIADDGKSSPEKEAIYDRPYPFDLQIINLEYDAGVGAGRNAIVENLSEEYIFIVDPDHEIPTDAELLYQQLSNSPQLGGIGGLIFEPDRDRLYSQARDFQEQDTKSGTVLLSKVPSNKEINTVAGAPLAHFDWIPNATLFRRECLFKQAWDSEYVTNYEHEDFYVAHWKRTDWDFAISPSVCFPHYPGGDTEYRVARHDPDKTAHSKTYFLNKWGYEELNSIGDPWINVNSTTLSERNVNRGLKVLNEEGLYSLLIQMHQYVRNRGFVVLVRQLVSYLFKYMSQKISVD
jgi:glycosyltransferase involved in cell wall biosynthesis